MTFRDKYGGLFECAKRARGRCLDTGVAMERFLRDNDSLTVEEMYLMRQHSPGLAAPRPSIRGPKPVYRDRPFYDAMFHEGVPLTLPEEMTDEEYTARLNVTSSLDVYFRIPK